MLTRRSLLTLAPSVLVPVAGCQTETPEQGVRLYEIQIRNDDTESHALTMRVEAEGRVMFQRDYELDPGTKAVIRSPVQGPGSYVVFVSYYGGDYRRDTTATLDQDSSCVVVIWEISRSGLLAGYQNQYTECPSRPG